MRLGAPVEMWTSEQILEKYGYQHGYLKDYKEFAADDDLNGPAFFIRALEDSGRYQNMTAQDAARAWLGKASSTVCISIARLARKRAKQAAR